MGHYDDCREAAADAEKAKRLASSCPLTNGELNRLSDPYFKLTWKKIAGNLYQAKGSYGLLINLQIEDAFWITDVSLGGERRYVHEPKFLVFRELYWAVKELLSDTDVMMSILFK